MNYDRYPPSMFNRDGEMLLWACRVQPAVYAHRAKFVDWCQENPELVAAELDKLRDSLTHQAGVVRMLTPKHAEWAAARARWLWSLRRAAKVKDAPALARCWSWLATRSATKDTSPRNGVAAHIARLEREFEKFRDPFRVTERVFVLAAVSFNCPTEAWGYDPIQVAGEARIGISRTRYKHVEYV